MTLRDVGAAAASAGAELGSAAARLAGLSPGTAVGAPPGRFGELVRALHAQLDGALAARSREARAHGARLAEVADLLDLAASGYASTDDEARRRQQQEGGG